VLNFSEAANKNGEMNNSEGSYLSAEEYTALVNYFFAEGYNYEEDYSFPVVYTLSGVNYRYVASYFHRIFFRFAYRHKENVLFYRKV
jgi:hypothetical protein